MAIIVNAQEMHDAADRLVISKDEIQAKLDEMRARINDLVTAGYDTEVGSKRFHDTFTQFVSGQSDSIKAIDSLATYLRQTADAFVDVDNGRG